LASSRLELLNPVEHRDDLLQADLAVLHSRDTFVSMRTRLINTIRGVVKSSGHRLRSCSTPCFHRLKEEIPSELAPALGPLFDQLSLLTKQIRAFDRTIEKIQQERYPEVDVMLKIRGVGALTAMAFRLVLADAKRFKRSRDAAAYVGLCPKQHESGSLRKDLGITKTGDRFLRRLLVHSAHYILGPFGEDCDLRRWGERLHRRGGRAAKKRAVVAVARKLAVVLHRLWADQSEYEALRQDAKQAA
jgi:transposase